MKRGGYMSRRIAEAMRPIAPVETPDTDAATVYRQQWRRRDGSMARNFNVLALDEEQAQELGGIRLHEKYNQNILDWELIESQPIEKTRSVLFQVLDAEDPDETKARVDAWHERHEGDPNPFEVRPS